LNSTCPFCNHELQSRHSKCFNVYCQGQKFNVGNFVTFRLNLELGIGRIIKKLEIPSSRSLDAEDTQYLIKFKVLFDNNIVKIIHPIDLIHHVFSVNEKIIIKEGVVIVNSNNFQVRDGLLSYEVVSSNGMKQQVFETDIASLYKLSIKRLIPYEDPVPSSQFLIHYWANLFHSYYTSYQIKCITNSRLSLMPHQINVAHRLSEDYFPRVILADEVGLGKTIEAGIFIKEMMARNLAERVLIIVPATLSMQWQFEMLNKFNIQFTIYDGKKIKELKQKRQIDRYETFHNPFYHDNLIICSLQFARNRKYIDQLSEINWDVVIFDEAHHLRRYVQNISTGNYRETLNYELARRVSESTESLLLLTATPLQLHSFELFSLIELIQKEAFQNYSDFEHFRKNMPFINLLVSNIEQIDKLNNFEVKNTIKLLKDLNYINEEKEPNDLLSDLSDSKFEERLIKNIEKDHTLSKFLIRNRKKNVFSEAYINKRIVRTIMVNPTKVELDLYKEIRLYLAKIYNTSLSRENIGIGFIISTLQKLLTSSKHAFLKSLERRLDQIQRSKNMTENLEDFYEEDPEYFEVQFEEEYLDEELNNSGNHDKGKDKEAILDLINQEKILKEFYNKLKQVSYDSKSDALIGLLQQLYRNSPHDKVIIFTQFVDTLLYLRDALSSLPEKLFVEVFYGGMDKNEKDRAVESFRTSETFSVLISTEIGGEGRNFQFCRILVNYDLPWNPMRLEQRIGRLDRIGQKSREIYIYNFFIEGTIETDIIFALDKRIHLFEESIGQLEPIIGNIEKDLRDIVFSLDDGKKRKSINEFNRKLDEEVKRAQEIEMQLDDLMIDKKSFQMDGLITSIESCDDVKLSHNELFLLAKYFFDLDHDHYGHFEVIPFNESINEVRMDIGQSLANYSDYEVQDSYYGTFDLNHAQNKEEIDFFALGHPAINSIIDYCKSNNFRANFSILKIYEHFLPSECKGMLLLGTPLYLFIYKIKFQGYILENHFFSIVINNQGEEIVGLSEFLLDIHNYEKLVKITPMDEDPILNPSKFQELLPKAKNLVKQKTSNWKREIKDLNDKIFTIERNKKSKIHKYTLNTLNLKLNTIKSQLERKKSKRLSEKQLKNVHALKDEVKKRERLEKVEQLEEEIRMLEQQVVKIERKLDDLAFDYDDLTKEMLKRNLRKFYTNLEAMALIKLLQ
jgi:SNF2 family DNA or RNA helicase